MKARFELGFGRNRCTRPTLVLEPEHGQEAILLATWLRYDANVISASDVERYEDGQIKSITLEGSDAE